MGVQLQEVRLFVSSLCDARFERSRLERVTKPLNGEFQGVALETEFCKGHATLQAQVPEAGSVYKDAKERLGEEGTKLFY